MYSVKGSGRNGSAIYSPALAGSGRDKLERETALHKAIEREELVLPPGGDGEIDLDGSGVKLLRATQATLSIEVGPQSTAMSICG